MSKTVQLKRGNANVSASYVGAEGEITVNTTDYTLNVHDGVTPGGYIITGIAGSNIGNLNFSNQTITGLNANANIAINTGNASLTIQGNASADYFLGNGSLLTGMNTYSNTNVQSLLSNYNSAITTSANITAGYFLGNGSLLTGINQAGFGNIVIQDQTISGKNEPLQALILGNGNVIIDNVNIINASLTSLEVSGPANFNLISVNNSIQTTLLTANSIGLIISNVSSGYYFVTNSNTYGSTTGLTHRGQSLSDPNVSVLALSHDVPVALFFSNGTNQLIGGLVVTGTDRPYGLFPNANVALYANVDSYSQVIHQNLSEGVLASTDYVSTANNGDDTTFYLDMGIAGNLHADPDFFGDTTTYNDAYLYVTAYDQAGPSTGNIGNLIIGSTNGIVKTFVGNTAEANVITVVDTTGFLPGANVVYNLGSPTRQWRDLWLSNSTFYLGGVPITVTANGQLSVNGSVISGNVGGGGNYDNSNVAAYLPTYTGNLSVGNILMAAASTASKIQFKAVGSTNGATIYDDSGSLILSPNTTYSPTAGVSIGGLGYLLAPNGARNLTLNYGSVNGQVGVQTNLVVGTTLTGGNITVANNIVASGNITGSYFIGNGALLTGISASGNYSDTNVAAYLPTYTGNIASNIVKNGTSWTFDSASTGSLTLPASSIITEVANPGGFPGYALSLTPDSNNILDADQKLLLYPTGGQDFNHLHLTTGNLYNTELYLGNDNLYVKLSNTGNIVINSDDNLGNTAQWTFDHNGNLTLADSGFIHVSGGITSTGASPAPTLSGFSSVSAISLSASGNIIAANISASGNITGNTAGFAIGYRDIPQITFTSNATLVLTDAGKHYYSANSANVITVPNNATVSFNIGTAITVVQQGTANLTITPDSGVTMYLSGNSTSAARTLGNYGMATLMKVATDTWFINGTGLE